MELFSETPTEQYYCGCSSFLTQTCLPYAKELGFKLFLAMPIGEVLIIFFFNKNLTIVITSVLLMLTEDKILISVQPEATMILSVVSSISIERCVM